MIGSLALIGKSLSLLKRRPVFFCMVVIFEIHLFLYIEIGVSPGRLAVIALDLSQRSTSYFNVIKRLCLSEGGVTNTQ